MSHQYINRDLFSLVTIEWNRKLYGWKIKEGKTVENKQQKKFLVRKRYVLRHFIYCICVSFLPGIYACICMIIKKSVIDFSNNIRFRLFLLPVFLLWTSSYYLLTSPTHTLTGDEGTSRERKNLLNLKLDVEIIIVGGKLAYNIA